MDNCANRNSPRYSTAIGEAAKAIKLAKALAINDQIRRNVLPRLLIIGLR